MEIGQALSYLVGGLTSISVLILLSLGLAIIFGLRGIINLAHGEFVMVGAYLTLQFYRWNLPIFIAIVLSGAFMFVFGLIVERLLIRRLYGRPEAIMLVTWGLSLVLIQSITIIFGPTTEGVPIPFGSFFVGKFSISIYSLVLVGCAIAAIAAIIVVLKRTSLGLRARAVARSESMSSSLGVNTRRVDAGIFAFGAAVTGATGGLLAPFIGISPQMGSTFIAESFMAVIVGGANFVLGLPLAATLLGGVQFGFASFTAPFFGQLALLLMAMIIIRFRPNGIAPEMSRR